MKISQVQAFQHKLHNNLQNKNGFSEANLNLQTNNQSYASSLNNYNANYGKALLKLQNTPSFGAFGFDDIILWGLLLSSIVYTGVSISKIIQSNYDTKKFMEKRLLEEAEINNAFNKDITKLANSLNISPSKAKKYHEKYLAVSYINPCGVADKEIGMNAVRGYGMEKYQLMKDFLSPMVMSQKGFEKAKWSGTIEDKAAALQLRNKVPNGILFYGPPGTGKTHIANKIGEHMQHFGANFVDLKLFGSSTENLQKFDNVIREAREKFNETGKYTIILLNDHSQLFKGGSEEYDLLLNVLERSKELGISFILTINDPKTINKALLRDGRLDIKMPIGKMEEFENADMINFALQSFEETKKYAKVFDIEKVVNKMKEENWAFTPAEIMGFARQMAKSQNVTEDDMIELMEQLINRDDFWGTTWNTLDSETVKQFNRDEEYVKSQANIKNNKGDE